ncbi:hypothetical protein [Amycolatopsis thermophila]|uniref:Uncharacterized protein n=1 Tax=Amycolatopsis thermophila TaxID=206084 RepID=A0ABU0EMP4_9PSEU|nr:hypothetical protein [Amycolatopsis thermophila]MDQ0376544.1 hypothetical protein [Amycolatopsis thermophila]
MIEVRNKGERMDNVDIIERIDHAIGCHYCGGPLGDSPSEDFCTYGHQRRWNDLYRRLGSVEAVAEELREEQRRHREAAEHAAAMQRKITATMSELETAFGRIIAAFRPFALAAATTSQVLAEAGLLPDRAPEDPARRALWLRRHRNTGPKPGRPRPPRTLNRR